MDYYSYQASARAWAVAAQNFIDNPSWSTGLTATAKFFENAFDSAALLLPGIPAVAGISGRLTNAAMDAGPGAWRMVNEAMSARAAAYQQRITGAAGSAYFVGGVKFYGYKAGVLLDAKGPGYAGFVKDGRFTRWFTGGDALIDQARRQLKAAGGVPIEWHVAEAAAAKAMRRLLEDEGIDGIRILHVP